MSKTGAHLLVDALADAGVKPVFTPFWNQSLTYPSNVMAEALAAPTFTATGGGH